ncbi:MAG: flagellar biosynthesis anti-sigma factor FlgM [Betaproteobacteria bacterium]|nr:flagellar biosynthesis anti-sigma factor FlgM [Betaproteobacteria bacterium]
MKIDNSIKTVGGISVSDDRKRADKSAGVNPNHPASPADNVHLSPLSSQLQAIESDLAHGGVVDRARVEEIKQAISDGRFKVNPEVIADRLLETVRDLIQFHRGKAG